MISSDNFFDKVKNRLVTIFFELIVYLLKLVGHIPSHQIRKFFYRLCGMTIGKASFIYMGAEFFRPYNIKIGQGTMIGKNCFLDGRSKLEIGDHVDIASDVLIYNDEHDINSSNFGNSFGNVKIDDYVFIGPRAIILPGVTISKGAVIAAGAIVTKDVAANEIWAGIPAKKIGTRQINQFNYKLGRPMLFQ